MSWKRCSTPAATNTTEPGWTGPYTSTSLRLPSGRALAVIAVTTSPARVASAPLLAPTGGGSC